MTVTEIYRPKTYDQIYQALKQYLIGQNSSLTNFNAGSRINTLLEAVALVSSQTSMDFFSALKLAIQTSTFMTFNFNKLGGTNSSGTIKFSVSSAASQTINIAVGIQISLNDLTYTTTTTGTIGIGQTVSSDITIQCDIAGVAGNILGMTIDTETGNGIILNKPDNIDFAYNPLAFAGGTDEETDAERLARFTLYINSLSKGTPNAILTGALSVNGVRDASIEENVPTDGTSTVYCDDGSGNLSGALQTEIQKVIDGDVTDPTNYPGYRAAGTTIIVSPPTIVSIPVTIEIDILTGSQIDTNVLTTIATNAITQYINSLVMGYDVITQTLKDTVQNTSSEIYDVILTLPNANVTIAANEIAKVSTISISIVRVNV